MQMDVIFRRSFLNSDPYIFLIASTCGLVVVFRRSSLNSDPLFSFIASTYWYFPSFVFEFRPIFTSHSKNMRVGCYFPSFVFEFRHIFYYHREHMHVGCYFLSFVIEIRPIFFFIASTCGFDGNLSRSSLNSDPYFFSSQAHAGSMFIYVVRFCIHTHVYFS